MFGASVVGSGAARALAEPLGLTGNTIWAHVYFQVWRLTDKIS
jgi:hypothetical protein